MTWINNDGLVVKFAKEEGVASRGGEVSTLDDGSHVYPFYINYTDINASVQILGAGSGVDAGSIGIVLPKGLYIEELETVAEDAFTSSGTIASATLALGLKLMDRSTELDHDGLLTTSFTGGNIDSAGEKTVVRKGSTGAGALIGTALTNNGVIVVQNSTHATNPYTAGKLLVRVRGYFK